MNAPDAVLLSFDLEFNRSLKSADLSSNKIGVDGIRALCDALKTNNSLESLTIRNPYSSDTKIDAAGAQLIADMLAVNRALTSVNLLQNDIGAGAAAIVAAAKKQGNIKTLCGIKDGQTRADFSECWKVKRLQAPDAALLSFDLEFNRALNSVDLRYNNIPDEGKQQLRDAVKGKNITLQL